ncbi:MAG TPA: hypothetical protein VK369_10635 [Segetibacter sp.]|nr:hypothetical protein [Segetibacter sp.]
MALLNPLQPLTVEYGVAFLWLFQSQLLQEQHLSLSSGCPSKHLEQPGFEGEWRQVMKE